MKHLALLVFPAIVLALPAAAQVKPSDVAKMKPSTKQVCTQRCNTMVFEDNPQTIEYQATMAQIQFQKKREPDPDKRKALEEQERREADKRTEFVGKLCQMICRHNPES